MPPIKQVNCPNCQKIVAWSEDEPYRPFCSRKCQLLDFGEWANEKHRIPTQEKPNFPDEDPDTH